MTLTTDLAGDWQYIDGIEDVTFIAQNRQSDPVHGVKALRRPMRRELSVAAQLGLPLDSVVFHLWASTMQGAVPQPLDRIEDQDQQQFTIQTASKETLGTRWRCLCSKAAGT